MRAHSLGQNARRNVSKTSLRASLVHQLQRIVPFIPSETTAQRKLKESVGLSERWGWRGNPSASLVTGNTAGDPAPRVPGIRPEGPLHSACVPPGPWMGHASCSGPVGLGTRGLRVWPRRESLLDMKNNTAPADAGT